MCGIFVAQWARPQVIGLHAEHFSPISNPHNPAMNAVVPVSFNSLHPVPKQKIYN